MFEFRALEVVHWDYWQRFTLPLDSSIVTVVGPNGSGKTTFLNLVSGFYPIDDGSIRVGDRTVDGSPATVAGWVQ